QPGPCILEQEAGGSGPQRRAQVLVGIEGGHDDHPRRLGLLHDPARGLQPIHPRHTDVHQHHIRAQPCCRLHGLPPGRSDSYHRDAPLGLEHHAEPGSHHLVVVGQQHADHRFRSSGSTTCTVQPSGSRAPARIVPPRASTRSDIPVSPYPPGPARRGRGGTPSPSISSSNRVSRTRTRTRARPSGAWRRTLVRASRTTRYAVSPTPGGSGIVTSSSSSTVLTPSRSTASTRPGMSPSP